MPNSSCESQLYKTFIEHENPLVLKLPACYFRSKENDADSQDNTYARCILHDADADAPDEGQKGCGGLIQQLGAKITRTE
jgi:hypothetical protein